MPCSRRWWHPSCWPWGCSCRFSSWHSTPIDCCFTDSPQLVSPSTPLTREMVANIHHRFHRSVSEHLPSPWSIRPGRLRIAPCGRPLQEASPTVDLSRQYSCRARIWNDFASHNLCFRVYALGYWNLVPCPSDHCAVNFGKTPFRTSVLGIDFPYSEYLKSEKYVCFR